jgi:hypothetical protein
VNLSRLLF